jgi:hypothetical protein
MKRFFFLCIIAASTVSIFYIALIGLAVSGIRMVIVPDGSETLIVTGHPDMPFVIDPRILCIQERHGNDPACLAGKMDAILHDGRELYRSSSPMLLDIGRMLD